MHVDGEVERAVVRIGAEVDQGLCEVESIVDDRDDRRGRAVAVGQLRIRAALDQRANRGFVTVAGGEHQRGESAGGVIGVLAFLESGDVRLLVGIGLRVEQRLNDLGVTFSGGAHQRGLLLIRVHRVHVGVGLEQQPHGRETAGEGRGHQRRFAFRVCQ